MKLRNKISSVFVAVFAVSICFIYFGLSYVVRSITTAQIMKQAQIVTLLLQRNIVDASAENNHSRMDAVIYGEIEKLYFVAEQSQSFDIRKILLVAPDYRVDVGFPPDEKGRDYSSHKDIRDMFSVQKMDIVFETEPDAKGKLQYDVDVVCYLILKNGEQRVLEVKLDFAKSMAMLESLYQMRTLLAIGVAMVLLTLLLMILLGIIQRTAIKPVMNVTRALETVGEGNLEVRLPETGNDEFWMLSRRFNEMVAGLKEKLQLSKYVSRGTVSAVRDSVASGLEHAAVKKTLVIFFSDIRGFTPYSESRDPEQIITVLNRILSLQAEVIERFGGDIDKYVGDEVMALFADASSAAAASIEIQKLMAGGQASVDDLALGIGLHYGNIVQGDVGSENKRNFTVIGDSVNTAARLQSIAARGEILVSEEIERELRGTSGITVAYKGELSLKGKIHPIKTFRITGT